MERLVEDMEAWNGDESTGVKQLGWQRITNNGEEWRCRYGVRLKNDAL